MLPPKLKEKTWSKEFEESIALSWKENSVYKFNAESPKKVYSIDTPPPYVNTPVHIGQATTYVLMDMFARFRRMTGYEVLFPLGLDRNGLPIEMAVEKKFNISLNDVHREEFIEKCHKVLEASSTATQDTFMRLGISFNSWKVSNEIGSIYLTDSPGYRALTQATFIELWHRGLIYEEQRINNYCPGCRTTIADAEIDYEEVPSYFNEVIFRVKETNEEIVIGTTRPELICTCGMIIFNPDDTRYKHLEGKTAITPLYNKEVLIKAHPLAQKGKGTGLVMMCSAGDTSDIRFFREMGLMLTIAINQDGRMNEYAGFLNGLKVIDARAKIIEELEKNALVVKKIKTTHRTPVCERSRHHIEFISMPEFYLKQIDFKNNMRELASQMNFFASSSRQILFDWIESVSIDWPISRRRYYATEIPLWYCRGCRHVIVPPKGRYYQPWCEAPPVNSCKNCGSTEFEGETRVFDTWFDSSITPLYILHYTSEDGFFEKNSTCSLRPQGKEIIRTWLYYTVLKDYLLTGKCIFQDVWINYHIVDEQGYKMSKSKGNVIDPKDVLARFGSEPFRLWAAIEGNLEKTDFRCSFERIEGATKTLTKLWNVARFISMFDTSEMDIIITETDKWILNEVNELVKFSKEQYQNYDFHNPAINLKHFIWETFASHYLELVKNRAYNENKKFSQTDQESAIFTLYHCLVISLKLLAPIIPFITYRIYFTLTGKDIHFEDFPEYTKNYEIDFTTDELVSLNSEIWKTKKDRNLSLKSPIKEITIPEKFKGIERDLVSAHNVERVGYGEEVAIKI